jgi:hypothetical protein
MIRFKQEGRATSLPSERLHDPRPRETSDGQYYIATEYMNR